MDIQELDVVSSQGSYQITTESGATYTLELLDGETNVVVSAGGSRNWERSLRALRGGVVSLGNPMIFEDALSRMLGGHDCLKTSRVIHIEPCS